jgi:pyruvate kinase
MDIIATIRPDVRADFVLDLLSSGVSVFRLNGAQTAPERVAKAVRRLRELLEGRARLMIDLPGDKVRTANLPAPIAFAAGDCFLLEPRHFNHPELCHAIRVGDEVAVNDGRNHLRVVERRGDALLLLARDAGELGNCRGLVFARTIRPPGSPLLFAHDRALLDVADEHGVDLVGVSFLRYACQKAEVLARVRDPRRLVYKIETREAAADFETLFAPGERVLLDRGDLAGEIGLLGVPALQKRVTAWAARHGVAIYVATQFLASMERHPVPTASEVHALYETIAAGVAGVQLSEETALGQFPLDCVGVLRDVERRVQADWAPARPVPDGARTPAGLEIHNTCSETFVS